MSLTFSAFNSHKLITWFSEDGLTYVHTIPDSSSEAQSRLETWSRVACVGEGAYGKVWKEVCTEKGKVRAVKVINKSHLANPTAAITTELSALTRMSLHPTYFVQLFGWFHDHSRFYIAMEYLPCGDLNTMIYEFDGLSPDQVKTASKQLLLGLEIMHGLGFCHRDLKPQNILVVKWYPLKVKIADFGTTKVAGSKTPLATFIGTPDYLAPEVLNPIDVDSEAYEYTNAVDIWSLGCLVYAMATKHPPFPGRRGLKQYIEGTLPLPGKDLETEMKRFIVSLMQPIPQERLTATQALEDPWLQPDADTWRSGIDLPSIHTREVTKTTIPVSKINKTSGNLWPESAKELLGHQVGPPRAAPPAQADLGKPSPKGQPAVAKRFDNSQLGSDRKGIEVGVLKPYLELPGGLDVDPEVIKIGKSKPKPQISTKLRGDALIEGAANGRRNVVQFMLERGADISHRDSNGDTALHRAIERGQKDISLFLIENGADKMAKGLGGATPLIIAARCGFLELVKLLLDAGSELISTDNDGFTALHMASQYRHPNVLRFMLGLDPEGQMESLTEGCFGLSGLHERSGWECNIKLALEVRAGHLGFTALHSAASTGALEIVELLLNGGADINARADDNSTPLTLAATDGHARIVELLLESGADINERVHHKYTALHLAAEEGHAEVVALLLKMGADTSAREDRGYTALQRAAATGCITIVEQLISWEIGATTQDLPCLKPQSPLPTIEQARKEISSVPVPKPRTYIRTEVVNRTILERSEIQQNHRQSIIITRQTDQQASRIELRGPSTKQESISDATTAASYRLSERKFINKEEKSVDGNPPIAQKNTARNPVGGPKTIQAETEETMKRKEALRKLVGKVHRSSCMIL